jgi:transposase-like protein
MVMGSAVYCYAAWEAARKLLYLATMDITRKWTALIRDWALVLAIRFEDRLVI